MTSDVQRFLDNNHEIQTSLQAMAEFYREEYFYPDLLKGVYSEDDLAETLEDFRQEDLKFSIVIDANEYCFLVESDEDCKCCNNDTHFIFMEEIPMAVMEHLWSKLKFEPESDSLDFI